MDSDESQRKQKAQNKTFDNNGNQNDDQKKPSANEYNGDKGSQIIESISPVEEDYGDDDDDDEDYIISSGTSGCDESDDNNNSDEPSSTSIRPKLTDKNNNSNNYYSELEAKGGDCHPSMPDNPQFINNYANSNDSTNLQTTNNVNQVDTVEKTTTTKSGPLISSSANKSPSSSHPTTSSCAKSINRKKRCHRRRYIDGVNSHLDDNDHDGDIDRSNDDFDEDDEDCENSGIDCHFNNNIVTYGDDNNNSTTVTNHDTNSAKNINNTAGNRWKQQEKSTFHLRSRLQQAQARNKQDANRSYNLNSDHRTLKGGIASSDRSVGGSKCNYSVDKKETFYNQRSSQLSSKLNNLRAQCNESNLSYILKFYLFISKFFYNTRENLLDTDQSSDLSGEEEEGEVTEDNLCNRDKHRKVNFGLIRKRSNFLYEQPSDECESSLTMPSSSNRYQPLLGVDDSRPHRKLSSRNRTQRLGGPSGYSRLNHNYHNLKPRQKQTFCQEFKRFLLLVAIIAISCLILWQLYRMLTADYNYLGVVNSPSILGRYKRYAVSTDAKPCAKVGKSLLAKGGSAVDAAVGTLICMGVVIPNSLGIGGGSLMTIYDAKRKEAVVIDGREVAPDFASENMFSSNPLSASRGPLSVGIPGELAASYVAHQKYGKLKWNELFNESIEMAEKGAPMVEHLAFALKTKKHAQYIQPDLAKIYTNPKTGMYYEEGDVYVQKELAETLKRIRDNGASEFYNGTTGRWFVEDLQKLGGKITFENLASYKPEVKVPLTFKLADDLILHTQPLPGSGIVLSVIMRIMKELGYYKNLKPAMKFEDASLYYHHLAEAFKFAYAQRAGLEDQPEDKKRLDTLIGKLSSQEFISSAAQKIDNTTHDDDRYGGREFFSEDHGTAHVSVVDEEGNAVAITSSINLYFGSGLISPRTGIVYNDVMDDFVSPNITNKFGLAPSNYNHIKPGRRPISSMAPSVFTDSQGNVKLVIGASGGTKITTSIASVSLRNCYLGEDIKTAVDGPRIHHQFLPNLVSYEINFSKDLLNALIARGHMIEPIRDRSSVIMAIAVDNRIDNNGNITRVITANSDYRKGGSVDGA